MPFVELRGLRFYYETRGKGPRLLLFSGSGGDLRRRPGLLDSPLAEHFELLCHDQRGLGQSDRPDIDLEGGGVVTFLNDASRHGAMLFV